MGYEPFFLLWGVLFDSSKKPAIWYGKEEQITDGFLHQELHKALKELKSWYPQNWDHEKNCAWSLKIFSY